MEAETPPAVGARWPRKLKDIYIYIYGALMRNRCISGSRRISRRVVPEVRSKVGAHMEVEVKAEMEVRVEAEMEAEREAKVKTKAERSVKAKVKMEFEAKV